MERGLKESTNGMIRLKRNQQFRKRRKMLTKGQKMVKWVRKSKMSFKNGLKTDKTIKNWSKTHPIPIFITLLDTSRCPESCVQK